MRRVEHVMGFPVSLRIDDEGAWDPVADEAFAWLRAVDRRFSPFRADSEVSRLDRGELAAGAVSADLAEVLGLCEEYRTATGGAFDARLPGRGPGGVCWTRSAGSDPASPAWSSRRRLDPCAVVKGWSVQRAAELLTAAGARRFCLNAGGDVVVSGGPWRVGIRHPEDAGQVCAVLEVTDGAVATSGRYERGDHILDGRTGRPATGLLSLTVLAPTLTEADATATAAFALGEEGVAWAAARAGCEVFAVDAGRRVVRTAGVPMAGVS
ncbi:FAD:protein FMN transferase [Streptomyces sp. Ag109_G2-15]|uniref:FAD:protein FMN transferase n=1 Tax=Streptomyces sp. Ag109_G2-15 TaxID=1938850 RepID=UPI000BE2FB52|nr:FAD:protein FMN transferase [Streptomyces sp. Ag109_G2-15]